MREHEKVIDEKLRHRKKSKTASISNSSKRADHKHQYERVIVKSFLGYRWGRKCRAYVAALMTASNMHFQQIVGIL